MDLADPQLAQRIIDATPAIALVLDLEGRIQYLNPFGEQLTGYALVDLKGRNWFDTLLPDDDRERVRGRFQALLAGTAPQVAANDLLTRDGRRRAIEWSSRCLYGADGAAVGVLGSGTDVTDRLAAEQTLRERELAYRQLFESNPQPMWVYDLATLRFLAVNDAAVAHYGYAREEFLAMCILDIRPAEDLPALRANLAQPPVELESSSGWRHRRKDGSLMAVEITSHGLDFEGRAARLVLIDDVTQQREAERQREVLLSHWRDAHAHATESRDLLHDVLDRVADGFVALDLDWRYTFVNQRGAKLLGRDKPEDLIGKHIWTEFPESVGQPFALAYQRALSSQQPVIVVEHYAPWDRWFENRIYPSANGLSVYFTDITARRKAEMAMQRSEQQLRHYFDSGLVGMAITLPNKQWHQFNAKLCELLGRSADELILTSWADLTHADDLAHSQGLFEQVMAGEIDGYQHDKRYIRADGTVLEAAVSVGCERGDDGRPRRFFAVIQDIGPRKQAALALARHRDDLEAEVQVRTAQLVTARDEAERANRAKSLFLSRMSHELRTPLNAILGFSQLMALDTELAPKHRDFIDEMLRAGRHLLNLINEVLDLASIESGRLTLSPEPLLVGELLDDCVRMMTPLAKARSVQIERGGLGESGESGDHAAQGMGAELVLLADRTRLRQVLLNLMSNAVKYNRVGGRITLKVARQPEDRVRLSVTDTGPGIAEHRLHLLFEPFERLGAEFGEIEGTGVGLNIARQLVEAMGGSIGVDGRPGQGACFWVDLPGARLAAPPSATDQRPASAVGSPAPLPPRTVLYVEDNPANLRLVEQIAARHAHIRLLPAVAAVPGLALARQALPDLILLDIHLPDADGYAVLAQLRADPSTRAIPVVALTAQTLPADLQRMRDAGFKDCITKPIDIARLDALLAHVEPWRTPG